MMFSKYFVVSVRVNGKILRDNDDVVTLPFGSEYEILIKNLRSRRAMVKVSVDGVDITDGTRLIIGPNDSISLERFIKNGNLSSGNKLKFIERTGGVEAHRGIKQDDGLIRCEFWAEKELPQEITQTIVRNHYVDHYNYPPYYYFPRPYYGPWTLGGGDITWTSNSGSLSGGAGSIGGELYKSSDVNTTQASSNAQQSSGAAHFTQSNMNVNTSSNIPSAPRPRFTASGAAKNRQVQAKAMRGPMGSSRSRSLRSFAEDVRSAPINDAGITVAGAESSQQFYSSMGFALEENSQVIVLQLRGSVGGVAVEKPVTVDLKPKCSSCGKQNKANAKFCTECGTALFLI